MEEAAVSGHREGMTPVQGELPISVPPQTGRRPVARRLPRIAPSLGDLVLDFHRAFRLPRNAQPTLEVAPELAALRLRLLAEESRELQDAIEEADLIAIADALGDITYVIFGTAVTYGIDLEAVVREIHRSNMSKLGRDGRPVLRPDGKVLKSDRYTPPDINTVLGLQAPLF